MTATLDGTTTAAPASKAAVTLSGVTKAFGAGNRHVLAIDGIDLEVPTGSFTCIAVSYTHLTLPTNREV